MENVKKIVSFGGGTNSTAMLIGMWKNDIKPDHILFADTGGEKERTYLYIDVLNTWLNMVGFPQIETVRYRTKDGVEISLEQEIINNQTLPAIAFGFKSCSEKFKIRPQNKFLKERYPDCKIIHYIGFDSGESRRVKNNDLQNHENIYPLIEWGWNRKKCIEVIREVGLPLPGKSSCFFCPNMRKNEILNLSDSEKERVKFIEANAKNKIELKGLGRQYSWTDLINSDESQRKLFDDLDMYQMPCECID